MIHAARILFLLLLLFPLRGNADTTRFYLLEFRQDVDKSAFTRISKGLKEAEKRADYCIIDLNTYGGAVDAAACRRQPLQSLLGGMAVGIVLAAASTHFIGFFPPRRALPSIGCLLPRQRCRLWKPLPTGHSRPYWKPRAKGKSHPFGIPARFEMSTHKQESVFVDTHFKTQKTPGYHPIRR